MIFLGIDTSAYANSIGVVKDGKALADFTFEARSDSLQKIIVHIDSALKSAGLTLDNVQGFGVGLGPGSWTGIRVGVTVAKMLAFSTDKPICGVSTLEALAFAVLDARNKMVCSVISMGTGSAVYAACYKANGGLTRIGDYYVGEPPGLAVLIKEPIVLAGPEAVKYADLIRQASPQAGIEAREGLARGTDVARIAAGRFVRGEVDNALALTPLYLKESTAKAFTSRYSGATTA